MTRTELVPVLVALAALACASRPSAPAPRPIAILPGTGFAAGGDVEIDGESFEVLPVQRLDDARSEIVASYRAWLSSTELTDVTWVDARTLRAHVPPGLALGKHDLIVEGPFGRGELSGKYEVIAGSPASVSATLAAPTSVAVGGDVDVLVTVTNGGEATVEGVAADLTAEGAGGLIVVAAGAPQDVPAGASRTFAWRCRATRAGDVTLSAAVRGRDPRTGGAVSATDSANLVVADGAAITLAVSVPAGPLPLGEFPVAVTVANVGSVAALGVTLSDPAIAPASTAAAIRVAAPTRDGTLGSGNATTLTWSYRAIASGTLRVEATVSWTDGSGAVRTASATSGALTIAEQASVVAFDPLGDGSPFAFVAPYHGAVVLGPSQAGTKVAVLALDGSAPERVALSFPKDTTGNVSSNAGPAPYASIGFTGCSPTSPSFTCGPDNEDGRGLLTSVSFGGAEWLVLGGARSGGELDYVYLSRETTAPLAFSYVDVGGLLGAATRGFTAAAAAGGGSRLYLGFADNGGNRPYGLALLSPPPPLTQSPGLDVSAASGLELGLHNAYDVAYKFFTTISMVDAIAELNGHVYFFGNSGCLGSTTGTPAGSGDFFACSPSAGLDYGPATAVPPPGWRDLAPRDRAWPQIAVWNGRLYAAHNTSFGPQLWCCDPARRGDPVLCEPDDWSLVAADATFASRLGNPTASAVTLLVATPTHLFVGFDDDDPGVGIHVYRTNVAAPTAASDFTGQGGCRAGTSVCQGLGGDGLGQRLTRIFDAKAIATPDERTDLFFTTGDGAGPVRVVRMAP